LAALGALLAACGGGAAANTSPSPPSTAPSAPATAKPSLSTAAQASGSPSAAASVSTSAQPAASASGSTQPATSASASAQPTASGQPATVAGVKLPTYTPVQGPKPDLPSGIGDVPDGYLSYPKNLFQAVKQAPGDGGDVTFMTEIFGAPPSPLDQYPAWQAVNKAMNANLKMTMIAFANYNTKVQSTIAGGDLPDVIFVPYGVGTAVSALPQFLQAKCAELTPLVSGDAVKDYPNLANIPTRAWKSTVFNGGIYGLPITLPVFFWVLWYHAELLEQASLAVPRTADEFKKTLQALTKNGMYGFGSENNTGFSVGAGLFPAMFGAPNNWQIDSNGKWTKDFETDQYKAAVGYARDLWAAGVYHPDSVNWDVLTARTNFEGRKFAFRFDGLTTVTYNSGRNLNPPSKPRLLVPPPADGSKGHYRFGTGDFGFISFKKTSADRLKMLLRISDYFAAPFGSQEYQLLHYGIEHTDFDLDAKGNPVLNKKGSADSMPWGSPTGSAVSHPPAVLFDPEQPDFAQNVQPAEKAMYAVGQDDPTVGYYSETNGTKGGVIAQQLSDGINAIVRGQDQLSNWDNLVKIWQNAGGNQIRQEYEAAYAKYK
jgi:putative aldouronate transport system substrate-binding protein